MVIILLFVGFDDRDFRHRLSVTNDIGAFLYTNNNTSHSYVTYQSITINHLSTIGGIRPRMRLNTHRSHPHHLRMGAGRHRSFGYP